MTYGLTTQRCHIIPHTLGGRQSIHYDAAFDQAMSTYDSCLRSVVTGRAPVNTNFFGVSRHATLDLFTGVLRMSAQSISFSHNGHDIVIPLARQEVRIRTNDYIIKDDAIDLTTLETKARIRIVYGAALLLIGEHQWHRADRLVKLCEHALAGRLDEHDNHIIMNVFLIKPAVLPSLTPAAYAHQPIIAMRYRANRNTIYGCCPTIDLPKNHAYPTFVLED